jgi:hypothetical protein
MKRDPMAGSWIIEGAIATLTMLLIGSALNLSPVGWWGVVSLLAGCATGALLRGSRRSRNGQH